MPRIDHESQVIISILDCLTDLPSDARKRVVDYALRRFISGAFVAKHNVIVAPPVPMNLPMVPISIEQLQAIGKRIRQLRQQYGVRQTVLADQCNMTQSGLSQVETGLVRPPLELLMVLSCYYDTYLEWILWNKPTAS